MGSKKVSDPGAGLREQAVQMAQKAAEQYSGIVTPDIEAQKLALEAPELVGLLQAEQLAPSALEGVSTDPRLRAAQLSALQSLQERGAAGFTPEDQALLAKAQQQAEGQAAAQAAAVGREMAERGLTSSGQELALRAQAGQSAASRQAQAALDIAAQSAAAKRQALAQAGGLGAQIEQTQFGQEAQKASAKDAIAQMNARMKQDVAAANLASRQRIAEAGTGTRNLQQQYNKQLQQQQFENQMKLAGGKAQTYSGAGAQMQQAAASMPITTQDSFLTSFAAPALQAGISGFASGYGQGIAKKEDGGIIRGIDEEQLTKSSSDDYSGSYADGGITKETYSNEIEDTTPPLKKSVFSFKDGGLTQVENHYADGGKAPFKRLNKQLPYVKEDDREFVENALEKGQNIRFANRNQNAWVMTKDGKLYTFPMGSDESRAKQINIDTTAPLVREKFKQPRSSEMIYGIPEENPFNLNVPEYSEGGMPDYMDAYAEGGVIESKLGQFRQEPNAVNKYSDAGMPVKLLDVLKGLNTAEQQYFDKSFKFDDEKAMAHLAGGGIATKFLSPNGEFHDGMKCGGIVHAENGYSPIPGFRFPLSRTTYKDEFSPENQYIEAPTIEKLLAAKKSVPSENDIRYGTPNTILESPELLKNGSIEENKELTPLQRGLLFGALQGLAGGLGGLSTRKKTYYPRGYQALEEGGVVGKDLGKLTTEPNVVNQFTDAGTVRSFKDIFSGMSSEENKYFEDSFQKDQEKAFRFPTFADGGIYDEKLRTPVTTESEKIPSIPTTIQYEPISEELKQKLESEKAKQAYNDLERAKFDYLMKKLLTQQQQSPEFAEGGVMKKDLSREGKFVTELNEAIRRRDKLAEVVAKSPENKTLKMLMENQQRIIDQLGPKVERDMALAQKNPMIQARQQTKLSQLKDFIPQSTAEAALAPAESQIESAGGRAEAKKMILDRLTKLGKFGAKAGLGAGMVGAGLAALGSAPAMAAQMALEPSDIGVDEDIEVPKKADGGYFGPHYNHTANYQEGGPTVIGNWEKGGIQDGKSFTGDKIHAKINSGEMVTNLAQQQKTKDAVNGEKDSEYVGNRVDEKVANGEAKINEDAQQQLFDFLSGKTNKPPKKDIVETKKRK